MQILLERMKLITTLTTALKITIQLARRQLIHRIHIIIITTATMTTTIRIHWDRSTKKTTLRLRRKNRKNRKKKKKKRIITFPSFR
mmetsp:Transcript_6125/g.18656  ORF Transcript_6125/g.18656 Transcript_6125/m.18656 type:complete len:86 (+) Transcript_6125:449-706(+)